MRGPWNPKISDASGFAAEVGLQTHPAAEAPAEAPLLRWDFSAEKLLAYDFSQKVRMKSSSDGPGGMSQQMDGTARLEVRSRGNGTGDLYLKDVEMSLKVDTGDGKPRTTTTRLQHPFVIQGVREDGSMKVGSSSTDALLKALFPLPPEPLAVGESASVPASMPFNAMGSVLSVTGTSKVTLAGYVKIGGRTCARLEVDTDVSKLDLPEGVQGSYACLQRGKAVLYFDVDERAFVSGEYAILMAFSIDAPAPVMKVDGEAPPDMPSRMRMSMESDNLITVSRAE